MTSIVTEGTFQLEQKEENSEEPIKKAILNKISTDKIADSIKYMFQLRRLLRLNCEEAIKKEILNKISTDKLADMIDSVGELEYLLKLNFEEKIKKEVLNKISTDKIADRIDSVNDLKSLLELNCEETIRKEIFNKISTDKLENIINSVSDLEYLLKLSCDESIKTDLLKYEPSKVEKSNKKEILAIKNLRVIINSCIAPYFPEYKYDVQKMNIITDALVYLAFKSSDIKNSLDINENFINNLSDESLCKVFANKIKNSRKTMQNVIDAAVVSFGMENKSEYKLENIIKRNDLSDKEDIAVALQMYLLKGHFSWVNAGGSIFKNFIHDMSKDNLEDDAKINCWEAVLYGFMKAGVISRDQMKETYTGDIFNIQDNLRDWFDFSNSESIATRSNIKPNWTDKLSKETYFIMIDELKHDMVSVPFSQKQLLKMLITEKFNERPFRPKLFSHWIYFTDSKLGTVSKKDFESKMIKKGNITKIMPRE